MICDLASKFDLHSVARGQKKLYRIAFGKTAGSQDKAAATTDIAECAAAAARLGFPVDIYNNIKSIYGAALVTAPSVHRRHLFHSLRWFQPLF